MQKIIPHLWFNTEAKEASEFYTSLLPNSKVTNIVTIRNTPSGDCDIVTFDLAEQTFMAINRLGRRVFVDLMVHSKKV